MANSKGNVHTDVMIYYWYLFISLCGWYGKLAPPFNRPIGRQSEAGYRPAKSGLLFIEFPEGS